MSVAAAPPPTIERELTDAGIQWELQPLADDVFTEDDVLTSAIVEAESYRALAQQAIHALHTLQRKHNLLRARHLAVLSDARRAQRA